MLMKKFFEKIQIEAESVAECMEAIARQHIEFERIHPFRDGNGRAGRMLLNQQLINHNLLPVAIAPGGKYRQSFRRYEKNEDISILVHELCKSEMDSIERVATLHQKYAERNVKPEKKMKL